MLLKPKIWPLIRGHIAKSIVDLVPRIPENPDFTKPRLVFSGMSKNLKILYFASARYDSCLPQYSEFPGQRQYELERKRKNYVLVSKKPGIPKQVIFKKIFLLVQYLVWITLRYDLGLFFKLIWQGYMKLNHFLNLQKYHNKLLVAIIDFTETKSWKKDTSLIYAERFLKTVFW